MEEKEQSAQEGRRLETKKGLGRGGRIAIVAAAVLAVLVGGYVGLCAYAAGDRALPGTYVGDVDLGGLTLAQAEERLSQSAKEQYETLEIPIQVGEHTVTFSAEEAGVHAVGGADQAVQAGKGNFLAGGWNYLSGLLGRKTLLGWEVRVDDPDYVNQVLAQVAQAVDQPLEEAHWELEETEDSATLRLYRGKSGQGVDQDAVYKALIDALGRGETEPIQVQVNATAPAQPDVDALVKEIDREPVDATLNVETNEVIPHKLGLTVDPDQARELFAAMAEGESREMPLEVREPEVTTLKLRSTLFQDLLGEATSKVGGNSNRVGNVTLAAAACNGKVLLPGEQMSYNQTTGQRTWEKGYRAASGFGMNGTEDMIGGGVCQPSSTLYLACLRANLEIVERTNHRYTVTYMPEGMDAQVSWPNMDYVFANNTPYPIKVEMTVQDRVCTARIYGTKTDDTYVEMESVRLGTNPPDTIYQADLSIPQGTTKVLISPFTGRSVEVYKNLYQGDGTLISRERITKNYYHKCDKVIGYNPLDGAPDGSVPPATPLLDPVTGEPMLDPNTGLPMLDPNASPSPSADPAASGAPTAEPGVSPAPATQDPAAQSPAPAPSGEPAPVPSDQPAPSGEAAQPAEQPTAQPDPATPVPTPAEPIPAEPTPAEPTPAPTPASVPEGIPAQ